MDRPIPHRYPQQASYLFCKAVTQVAMGSVLLVTLAQAAIHLPYLAAPITLQTLGVFILAGVLGSKKGSLAVLAYLFQASIGMPVLAGGAVDSMWWQALSAGYLLAFPVAAFAAGTICEWAERPSFLRFLGAFTVAQLIIWALGTFWLSLALGWDRAITLGVVPYIPGAALKILAATSFMDMWAWGRYGVKSLQKSMK